MGSWSVEHSVPVFVLRSCWDYQILYRFYRYIFNCTDSFESGLVGLAGTKQGLKPL